jgi:hypothetical protein
VWVKTAAFGILALAVAVGLNRTIFATPQALLLVPLVLAMLAFAAVRSIRRARELWLSIEWVITDHDLTRRSPHVPMVVIRRNEVVPLGVLVAAGLVWTVRATGRSKHVDERTRRHSLWLLLLLVVIALRITLVLSNGHMWAWTGAGQ